MTLGCSCFSNAPSRLTSLAQNNARFTAYCPYCQISTEPSPLPQGLKAPPAYEPALAKPVTRQQASLPPPYAPPPYSQPSTAAIDDEKAAAAPPPDDTLHFLDHEHDNIPSLSLRYGVPQAALRRANNITSDHLLLARKTILIPGEFYSAGISLSPQPIDGEEEELRKSKIRRLMTSCKLADYDVAQLYLEQAKYDLDDAIDAFVGDEAWEQAQRQKNGGQAQPRRRIFNRRR